MTRKTFVYACMGILLITFAKYTQISLSKNNEQGLPPVFMDQKISDNLEAGNWNAALDDLVALYEDQDADPNLRFYISLCYKELGILAFEAKRYGEAIELFETALITVDDDPDTYLSLGIAHFSKLDYNAAESAFEKVVALDGDNYMAYKQLGHIYYLKDDATGASRAWTKAIELNPKDQSLRKKVAALQKQISVSESFESDSNHLFSVYYDGDALPDMKYRVMDILESAYYDVGARLKAYPKRQIAVTLLTRNDYFDITGSPQWTAGLYEGQIKIPVVNVDYNSLQCVLTHEYVHAVIFDLMGPRCPWWLNEGLAQYYSEHDTQRDRKRGLAVKYLKGDQPMLARLPECLGTHREAIAGAYAMAYSAVVYFVDTYGDAMLCRVINLMASGKNFSDALNDAYGIDFIRFETDWRRALTLSEEHF